MGLSLVDASDRLMETVRERLWDGKLDPMQENPSAQESGSWKGNLMVLALEPHLEMLSGKEKGYATGMQSDVRSDVLMVYQLD
mmetsp:Transcript_29778/g.78136  ORF Transcript_29778/g.78136 Transcript_29778/m.78136 type:complete len:83 (-) Transcript_29778:39-287(-)